QQTKLAIGSIQYLTHPEEAAHRHSAGLAHYAVVDEEDKPDDSRKCQRGAAKQHGSAQERTNGPSVASELKNGEAHPTCEEHPHGSAKATEKQVAASALDGEREAGPK